MKKQIIIGIAVTACVALCAAVWPRSTEVDNLPVEPLKTIVNAEIEARSEEMPKFLISANATAPETEAVADSEPMDTEITAEEKTEQAPLAKPTPRAASKSTPVPLEPKSGDRAIIDGKPYVWIPGFGWIKDEGGGSVGTTVGNPGDELTGNKVGQM